MDYLKDIEINAPMLRYFDFGGNVASICLRNSPLLAKISLWYHDSSLDERKGDITKFFESFSALELLFLSDCSVKFLAAGRGVVPTRLPFDLNCVRKLKLHIDPEDLDGVSCALCLMRSSPCLQYIEIKLICTDCGSDDDESFPAQESLEVNWSSDVTFNCLREVVLRIFKDTEFARQPIKFLLTKSPLLVRMVIDLEKSLLEAVKSSANSFHLASPKAEIVYTGLF